MNNHGKSIRDVIIRKFHRAREHTVNKSIPQRMSVILFCVFGAIIITGIVSSLDRMLVATGEIVMEELNNTEKKQEQEARISKRPEELAILHLSFYIAYMLALVPCGVLADRYGGKTMYFGGMVVAAIVCLLLPIIATYFSWNLFCTFTIILGIMQAFIRIGEAVLVTRWTPISERACFGGFVFGARPVGYGLGHTLSWMAIHYRQYWFLVYLFWGISAILWSTLYILMVYDEPKNNPFVRNKEKELIEHEIPPRRLHRMPPWKKILVCRGVWALIVGQMGHQATMFIIKLPLLSYTWWFHKLDSSYKGYKNMATELDCLILLFTCVGLWLVSVSTGMVVDHAVRNTVVNLKNSRVIPSCVGIILPNTFLIIMVMSPSSNVNYTKIYYIVAAVCVGPYYASFHLIYMDITINFPGCIMSVMLVSGELVAILNIISIMSAKYVNWNILFWTMVCISIMFMGIFVLLMEEVGGNWDSSTGDWLASTKKPREVRFGGGSVSYFEPHEMANSHKEENDFEDD